MLASWMRVTRCSLPMARCALSANQTKWGLGTTRPEPGGNLLHSSKKCDWLAWGLGNKWHVRRAWEGSRWSHLIWRGNAAMEPRKTCVLCSWHDFSTYRSMALDLGERRGGAAGRRGTKQRDAWRRSVSGISRFLFLSRNGIWSKSG